MPNIVEFIYKLKDNMSSGLGNISKTAVNVAGTMEKAKVQNDKFAQSAEHVANKSGMMEGGLNRLIKTGMAYFGIMEGIRGGGAFLGLGMDMEQTRAKFEVLLGSVEKGNKMISDLNKFADVTPFENQDIIKASETMLAFGITGNKIMPTMKMLGDVSMGNREKLSGLTLAYSQVASTGRLMGQDLLQMVNVGFNPLLIISQKTGRSMAQLKKDMEGGKISFEMVEDAFRTATAEGGQFYNMMDKMSITGEGKMSTFFGNLRAKLTEYSEKMTPYIGKIMDMGIKLVGNFDKIAQTIWKILSPVRALVTGLWEMFKFFKQNTAALVGFVGVLAIAKLLVWSYTLSLKGWTISSMLQYYWLLMVEKAQLMLNATMLKNPVLLIVAGIALLIGSLMMMKKRTVEAYSAVGELNKKSKEYASDEKANLDMLFDKLKKTNPQSKERNELVKKLNEMYPDTLKNMNLEKAGLDELTEAYNKIIDAIDRKARARAAEEMVTELYKKVNDAKSMMQGYEPLKKPENIQSVNGVLVDVNNVAYNNATSGYKKVIAQYQKQIKEIEGSYSQDAISAEGSGSSVPPATSNVKSTSVSDITAGGAKATNISINFKNLIENYLPSYADIKEGAEDAERTLTEALLRVVNSGNRLGSN